MSGKSHLIVLRYRHFYTAKSKGNKKILTDIIKFISILENGNSGIFGIILKASFAKKKDYIKISFSLRCNFPPICDARLHICHQRKKNKQNKTKQKTKNYHLINGQYRLIFNSLPIALLNQYYYSSNTD